MEVAKFLSDLTTLQVCDPAAALALVSTRPEAIGVDSDRTMASASDQNDPDLNRAKDLLELHSTVKLAHQDGTDQELNEAREAVSRVLQTL